MIVRASMREPATSASVSRQSIAQTVRGQLAAWMSKKLKARKVTRLAARTPRAAPHVAGRDVAPPAVVEAEEGEDAELDHGDEAEDLPRDVVLVVDRQVASKRSRKAKNQAVTTIRMSAARAAAGGAG